MSTSPSSSSNAPLLAAPSTTPNHRSSVAALDKTSSQFGVWAFVLIVSTLPAMAIYWKPELYNELAAYLMSLLTTAGAAFLGVRIKKLETQQYEERTQELAVAAARSVQQQWLPQAEAASNRLLTIHADATLLKINLENRCSQIKSHLPKLTPDAARQIDMLFSAHCKECIGPITSMVNHMDGAIDAWTSFIAANCTEGECEAIFHSLDSTRSRLTEQIDSARRSITANSSRCGVEDEAAQPALAK